MYTGRHVLASEIYPSAQGPLGRRDPYGAPSRRHTRSSPPGGRTGYNLGGGGGRAGWTPDGADPSERCAQNMTPDSSPRLHLVLPARRVLSKPGQRPGPVLGAILRPRLRRTLVTYRLFVLARNPRPPSHESKGITPSGDFTPQLHSLAVVFVCAYTSAEISVTSRHRLTSGQQRHQRHDQRRHRRRRLFAQRSHCAPAAAAGSPGGPVRLPTTQRTERLPSIPA